MACLDSCIKYNLTECFLLVVLLFMKLIMWCLGLNSSMVSCGSWDKAPSPQCSSQDPTWWDPLLISKIPSLLFPWRGHWKKAKISFPFHSSILHLLKMTSFMPRLDFHTSCFVFSYFFWWSYPLVSSVITTCLFTFSTNHKFIERRNWKLSPVQSQGSCYHTA